MKLRHYLRALCPDYWLQLNPLSRDWDRKLRELLSSQYFFNIKKYTAEIGSCTLWIGNHPYASFSVYSIRDATNGTECRPRRATIAWAREKLLEDSLRQIKASHKV